MRLIHSGPAERRSRKLSSILTIDRGNVVPSRSFIELTKQQSIKLANSQVKFNVYKSNIYLKRTVDNLNNFINTKFNQVISFLSNLTLTNNGFSNIVKSRRFYSENSNPPEKVARKATDPMRVAGLPETNINREVDSVCLR